MNTHTIIGGGLKLHVWEQVTPTAGLLSSFTDYRNVVSPGASKMEPSLANDFRLVAMDLRGHGLSEKPRDRFENSKLWVATILTQLLPLSG
jgi:pimeloyl-ACP methyl ester carboxylesterase